MQLPIRWIQRLKLLRHAHPTRIQCGPSYKRKADLDFEPNGSNARLKFPEKGVSGVLIREGPSSGPLYLAPVSAKELKERAFQGVL